MIRIKAKGPVWLVVASTTTADIYLLKKENYRLIKTLMHPGSKLKSMSLMSDKVGHYKTCHVARGKFVESSDPHKQEHKKFAKEIANFLEKNRKANNFKSLIICAESYFYGLLASAMTKFLHALILKKIHKNYIPFPKEKTNRLIKQIVNELFYSI